MQVSFPGASLHWSVVGGTPNWGISSQVTERKIFRVASEWATYGTAGLKGLSLFSPMPSDYKL